MANRVSETTMALAGLALLTGFAVGGAQLVLNNGDKASGKMPLPECVTEFSTNCYWNAKTQGNGEGRSFTAIEAVYMTTGEVKEVVIYDSGEIRIYDN